METGGAEQLLSDEPKLLLRLLSINDMPRAWEQVEPLLKRACAFSAGEMTPELVLAGMGLHDGVERLRMLAIVEDERITSIMVVAVSQLPDGRVLDCLLVGGDEDLEGGMIRSWAPFETVMDEWARRELGCSKVRITRGRKGWLKALSHWRLVGSFVMLEREL